MHHAQEKNKQQKKNKTVLFIIMECKGPKAISLNCIFPCAIFLSVKKIHTIHKDSPARSTRWHESTYEYNKPDKLDIWYLRPVMYPHSFSIRIVCLSCCVNVQRRTELVHPFITRTDTHPIFLPVWIQTVVYCFNNTAPVEEHDREMQLGLDML